MKEEKKITKETRNSETLRSFVKFCSENPDQRFWQALLSWSKLPYICWTARPPRDCPLGIDEVGDTFYFEGRNK